MPDVQDMSIAVLRLSLVLESAHLGIVLGRPEDRGRELF